MIWASKWLQNKYEIWKPFLNMGKDLFLIEGSELIPDIDFEQSWPF